MSSVRPTKFVNLEEEKIAAILKQNRGMIRIVIPKGTYPKIDSDTTTVAIQASLIANKDVPDDIVEKVTKALVEGIPRWKKNFASMKGLTVEGVSGDIGIPYHPGALRYYKSIGVIK